MPVDITMDTEKHQINAHGHFQATKPESRHFASFGSFLWNENLTTFD